MKRCSPLLPSLLLPFLGGCLLGGSVPSESSDPLEWPEGIFILTATAQYTETSGQARRTSTEVYEAELSITSDSHMRLHTNAGMCRDPDRLQLEKELAQGIRTFSCGRANFVLRPAGSTVRGGISVPYIRTVRERSRCVMTDENGTCIEYSYVERERQAMARATLRVRTKG